MSQTDYARLIDVSQKTVWMWVSGRTPVPKLASKHLNLLLVFDTLHRQAMGRLKSRTDAEQKQERGIHINL
jgi:hypothetical protein